MVFPQYLFVRSIYTGLTKNLGITMMIHIKKYTVLWCMPKNLVIPLHFT